MDTLQTMPGAETATESLASPSGIEVPVGAPYTTRSLRLRRANREDVIRVPARLENWLPPDHPARRVWKTVEGLDLSEFYADIQVEEGTPGAPATDPLILVAVWVYATSQGETEAQGPDAAHDRAGPSAVWAFAGRLADGWRLRHPARHRSRCAAGAGLGPRARTQRRDARPVCAAAE